MTQWGSMLNYTEPGFSNGIRWRQEPLKRVTVPPPSIFLSPHTNINMPHGVLSRIMSCYCFCSLVTSDNSSTPPWKEYFVVENTDLSPDRPEGELCFLPIAACWNHLRFTLSVLPRLSSLLRSRTSSMGDQDCRLSLLSPFFCPLLPCWDLQVVTWRKVAISTEVSCVRDPEKEEVRCEM